MEMTKTEHEWMPGHWIYEGRAKPAEENGVRVALDHWSGDNWHVVVDLPHQCDNWEIAEGPVTEIDEVREALAAHIKQLWEAYDYLGSEHYQQFVMEAQKDGATTSDR